MHPPAPYVLNRLTGRSGTREFVEQFLDNAFNPIADARPLIDSIYCPEDSLITLQRDTYKNPPKNPFGWIDPDPVRRRPLATPSRYIGRAAHVPSSHNPHEQLWCVKADIARACKRLDRLTRILLGLKYVADLSTWHIAQRVGMSEPTVYRRIEAGLTQIARILDRIEND